MIPGPAIVYKCPNCGNFCQRGSLTSGNTGGARFYSDGSMQAVMLPEFPAITKCKKCEKFYWLDNDNKAGSYGGGWFYDSRKDKVTPKQWLEADLARLLPVEELQEAVDAKAYGDSSENEMYLRKRLWWGLNDKADRRDAEPLTKSITVQYAENCHGLIALLLVEGEEMSDGRRLMVAELCRNMEMFDVCEEVLRTIKGPELREIVDALIGECKRKNRYVVLLDR